MHNLVQKRIGIPSRNLQFLLAAIQYLRFLKNILTKSNNKHYNNPNTKHSKMAAANSKKAKKQQKV